MKGWKNIFLVNGREKQAGIAILVLYKMDLNTKTTKRNEGGHHIMTEGSNHQEVIVVNTYTTNARVAGYLE